MPTQGTSWPSLLVVGYHSQPWAIGTHSSGCPSLALLTTLTTTPELLASSFPDVNRPFCSYLARMHHTPVVGTAHEPYLSDLAITTILWLAYPPGIWQREKILKSILKTHFEGRRAPGEPDA